MRIVIHKRKKKWTSAVLALSFALLPALSACGSADSVNNQSESAAEQSEDTQKQDSMTKQETEESVISTESKTVESLDELADAVQTSEALDVPPVVAGEKATEVSIYTDSDGDIAYIPAQFMVSANEDEQTIDTGLVVIGPDESEYVWVPTTVTELAVRDFGSYFGSTSFMGSTISGGGDSLEGYYDETEIDIYNEMVKSTEKYGGFYIGRFEASKGEDELPASRRITEDESGQIWVQFSPQDTTTVCQNLYADNDTVQGFFPWGINWDTTLQWLIDSGDKQPDDINSDSTSWGNYSNDSFSDKARGNYTGAWEEAKSNNIYDLAGNNWEWTQERNGSSYVMRGGGYNLMGGSCPGDKYPAAIRDPLPGNDHHPNVTFRIALYVK